VTGESRPVASNQSGLHPRLEAVVRRHLNTSCRRPFAEHTRLAFERIATWRDPNRPLILDSGCGTGIGAARLAALHPEAQVLGLDKSAARLARHPALPANARLERAELGDFWRLAAAAGWRLDRHYLLYPNPWPKVRQLMRRWHGSPALPALLALGGRLELRSNWRLYVEEFARALNLAGIDGAIDLVPDEPSLTPFETKYRVSGQRLWRCRADLNTATTARPASPADRAG
jgi:tRNA (guanine-N7-)-methyltransferase